MIGFVLKVGNPYGPHDQRRYNGNKKDGVLARPKIVLETQVQPVQRKSLQYGYNQRGGEHRGQLGDGSHSLQEKRPPV